MTSREDCAGSAPSCLHGYEPPSPNGRAALIAKLERAATDAGFRARSCCATVGNAPLIRTRRLSMKDGSKKFGFGMVLGLAVGMLLYRLVFG